jgi:hypothetical protein
MNALLSILFSLVMLVAVSLESEGASLDTDSISPTVSLP